MSDDDKVRFNVRMPEQLRDDAKRNSERGELADEVRDVFRRKAYGTGATDNPSEIEEKRAELRETRERLDEKRRKRGKIENQIQSLETRTARLEEQISELEEERDELEQTLDTLENMLQSGERMWPVRIKNAADVDPDTARDLYEELRGRNAELPDEAFEEPTVQSPADWRDEANEYSST